MKNDYLPGLKIYYALIVICVIWCKPIRAQEFQKAYGTALDNVFSKVIQDGENYYVLGQDESANNALPRATVTRISGTGEHLWTHSLGIPSVWHDAVLTSDGDLILVGETLPSDESNKSIIARYQRYCPHCVVWARSYDVPGHESFTRIVRNSSPSDSSFIYYVLGYQGAPFGNPDVDDVVLLNMNDDGEINWKKRYAGAFDDEYYRDFLAMPNGDLVMAGNLETSGTIVRTDNFGAHIYAGSPEGLSLSYTDIALSNDGGLYAVGESQSSVESYLMKYDVDLFPVWNYTISGLSSVKQVWADTENGFYVTGEGVFDGKNRTVIMRFLEVPEPELEWLRFLDNGETSYTGGSAQFILPDLIAYVDGRNSPSGFGQNCAFMSVSNTELTTCMTKDDNVNIDFIDPLYNSPEIPIGEFYDILPGTDLIFSVLDWEEQEVCNETSCQASFLVDFIDDCGNVQLVNQSTGTAPILLEWENGSGSQVLDLQLPCGVYTYCLSITDGEGCKSTACQTFTVQDIIPPTAVCAPGMGYELEADCNFKVTAEIIDGGSFDNCLIQSMTVSPTVVSGCGIFPVTLTVRDWCGNTRSCVTEIQTGEDVPPLLACPPNITVMGVSQSGELCVGILDMPVPEVSDNCGQPVHLTNDYTNSANASGVYPLGLTNVIWTATDGCGNVTTCAMTVTVTECPTEPSDTSCCAYTIHLYNEYTDFSVKKVRLSATCDTRICCSDPDEWAQSENYPYYIEYYPPDGSGFPTGPGPLDVIDNDFEIWLENSTSAHTIQVDWYDFADNIINSHEIEIDCDGDFDEDEDWTLFTQQRCCNDPKLFVFAVREPGDDGDLPCGEFDREVPECDISQTVTCCGNEYCVELTPPANYTSWIWSIQKEYAPSSYTPPTITTHSDGRATFKVPKDGSESGRFNITLTAENLVAETICTGEEEVLIPFIIPDFTFKLLPCGLDVQFTPQITNFAGDVASISWSATNDPNFPTSGSAPFNHTFPGQAIYKVTMVITDKYGCIHTVQHDVNNSRVCTPSFEVKYTFCDQLCAAGIPQDIEVIFKNTSKGGSCPTTFTWNLDDGTTIYTSSSDPDSFKHTYLQVPCPTGMTYNITLTMDDAQSTMPQCGGPKVHSKPIHVSPCHVDINYIKCPNGSVIFTSNVPGIWEFPGSTSIDEAGSEAKDVNGRRSKVRVRYSIDAWYVVHFTGYCPNGGICKISEEIQIETICCVRNNTIRDDHRFTENGRKYKMKYRLAQNQYFGNTPLINIHNIKAVTQLKRRNSKVYNFWKNTNDGALTAGFTGTIYTKDSNCSCNVAETVNGPNPGPHSGRHKVKTKLNKLGKYHSRKDSIISTHTVTVGSHTFTDHLMLGKICNPFQWWVN